MKIAVVIPTHWGYRTGGSQFQARLLMDVLAARPSVDMLYLASRVPNRTVEAPYRIRAIGRHGRRHHFGYFWDVPALWKILDEERPDVIYQRVACAYTGICAAWSRRNGARMIWHLSSQTDARRVPLTPRRLLQPHKLIEKRMVESGVRHADLIVAQTNDQRQELETHYGRPADMVIRNFHPPVPSLPPKTDAWTEVLWIANLKDVKRPGLFLDLAGSLADIPRLRFTMIGAPYLDPGRQAVIDERLAVLGNVHYTGRQTEEQVAERLAAAHLLVNTSEREGFSNTFIQAWMNGVPVLSIGINPDGLLNGGALGKSVRNTGELAAILRELSSGAEALQSMGATARAFAQAEFGMDNAEQLADVILDSSLTDDRQTTPVQI